MLEGSDVALETRRWFRRRRARFGFFTTRFVLAFNSAAAADEAIALARAELDETNISAFTGDKIAIRAIEVEVLPASDEITRPGRGFTFFPEGTDDV
jgi:hypothetical protein